MRFAAADAEALQQLVFDPTCEPSYELLKACLVWPDERPARISKEGYRLLSDLWIVRGFLHRQLPPANWGLDPSYFQEFWRNALADVPEWPGFRRLELSGADREYLRESMNEAAGEGG